MHAGPRELSKPVPKSPAYQKEPETRLPHQVGSMCLATPRSRQVPKSMPDQIQPVMTQATGVCGGVTVPQPPVASCVQCTCDPLAICRSEFNFQAKRPRLRDIATRRPKPEDFLSPVESGEVRGHTLADQPPVNRRRTLRQAHKTVVNCLKIVEGLSRGRAGFL